MFKLTQLCHDNYSAFHGSLFVYGILDFTSVYVQLDGIIGLNDGIRVVNSGAIGGVQVWDILGFSLDLTDTAQFVLSLLVGDPKK